MISDLVIFNLLQRNGVGHIAYFTSHDGSLVIELLCEAKENQIMLRSALRCFHHWFMVPQSISAIACLIFVLDHRCACAL